MTSKDKFLQIRISEIDKEKLIRLAKKSGLTISDLINLKIEKMLEDFERGIIQPDVQAQAFDKVRKKQGVLKFENVK